jgi:hypothetical protein
MDFRPDRVGQQESGMCHGGLVGHRTGGTLPYNLADQQSRGLISH